jgi:hypothetical protein
MILQISKIEFNINFEKKIIKKATCALQSNNQFAPQLVCCLSIFYGHMHIILIMFFSLISDVSTELKLFGLKIFLVVSVRECKNADRNKFIRMEACADTGCCDMILDEYELRL